MVELQQIITKLRNYRRFKGIRGPTVTRESGLSAAQISKIESGGHDMRITTFMRYINSLGMEIIIKEKDNET